MVPSLWETVEQASFVTDRPVESTSDLELDP